MKSYIHFLYHIFIFLHASVPTRIICNNQGKNGQEMNAYWSDCAQFSICQIDT